MFDIWFWFISGGSDCILEMQKKALLIVGS